MNRLPERVSAEEIYGTLRGEILAAILRPGAAISETRMAARFGVSRTPVREIFKRLEEEGFLQVVPQVGTFVAAIDLTTVYDSQFVRETLECRMVAMAAEKVEDSDRAMLARFLSEQERAMRADDRPGFFASDEAFHAHLARMAGHAAVWGVIQSVNAQLSRVRCLALENESWRTTMYVQHQRIMERVLARDPAGAEAAMREHLRSAFEGIEHIAQEYVAQSGKETGGRRPRKAPVAALRRGD